jgi:hypothetical protein
VNDRYRPDGGFDDRASVDGGMPPASRNHRVPTTGDTPASTAASSLGRPAAIDAQNRRRSSRRATPGQPGERVTARSAQSDRRFRVPIATPSVELLRRPPESTDVAAVGLARRCRSRLAMAGPNFSTHRRTVS